jgi:hypothetical protein
MKFKQLDHRQYHYSFGVVNWHQEGLQELDREKRKLLATYGQHHPKADVDCMYVPENMEEGV